MISENTIIMEVLQKFPDSVSVFARYGMKCLGWGGVAYESVGQAARVHGINLENLMSDLKKLENA